MSLVDGAVQAGWAHSRACRVLQVADVRMHRWRGRLAETGTLDDRPPIGTAVHRILESEEWAILDLIEQFSGQFQRLLFHCQALRAVRRLTGQGVWSGTQ